MKPRPAVFLDRDGVIIDDVHYLAMPDQVRLIPGSAEAIAALNQAGWPVVVATNQAGVGRGLFTEADVQAVHRHLSALLAGFGAKVDAFYYCPHFAESVHAHYRAVCSCRKPQPGLLRQAAAELDLDLARSWMIGDRESDLQAGAAAGARTVLVRTGYGAGINAAALDRASVNLELVAANLADAVEKCGLTERIRHAA
ncbi:MAG TPA: D-glycero-beta-D-manno-heptose 1,7-bisphosphate 7-phosphatase [Urbifossiella sp.]|jgi:D-glycero-D-manno-heptose 1,7-bisphosphate phosphatase|nr:D-glycero-beta-D-manno-heptose 1,7-bisphosphate 7-phosphatase [Urbifossiella sp.]